MALTLVTDTRFLITFWFPPTKEVRMKISKLINLSLKEGLIVPVIVIAEYVKVAGGRIGLEAAKSHIYLLVSKGAEIANIDNQVALKAGEIALRHPEVPMADALIASVAIIKKAKYILTDDPHFRVIGLKTKWI